VSFRNKQKGLNRIAKIGYGHLWLREENLSFDNHIIFKVRFPQTYVLNVDDFGCPNYTFGSLFVPNDVTIIGLSNPLAMTVPDKGVSCPLN
jgi:hypothetical protein